MKMDKFDSNGVGVGAGAGNNVYESWYLHELINLTRSAWHRVAIQPHAYEYIRQYVIIFVQPPAYFLRPSKMFTMLSMSICEIFIYGKLW